MRRFTFVLTLISVLLMSFSQAFAGRYYGPSEGRFLTVDPKMDKYPALSPYVYAANNPLMYIDPDGNENKKALEWATKNMANKGIPFDIWYGSSKGGWTFQANVVPTQTVCYESCFMAYMNSGQGIRNYLQDTGYSSPSGGFKGRAAGMEWFQSGGDDRSFVTDITNGEVGDITFMGEMSPMHGHAVLLESIVVNEDGSITLNTLSTGTENGDYGNRTFIFKKNEEGQYVNEEGYTFRGYGQMHNTEELEKKDE